MCSQFEQIRGDWIQIIVVDIHQQYSIVKSIIVQQIINIPSTEETIIVVEQTPVRPADIFQHVSSENRSVQLDRAIAQT